MKAPEAKKKKYFKLTNHRSTNIFKEFFCFCDREPSEEPRSI